MSKLTITPYGDVLWAHIFEPQKPYKDGDAERFTITLAFDKKDAEWKAFADRSDAMVQAAGGRNFNVKPDKKDGKATGLCRITFKTGIDYPPKVIDVDGNAMSPCKIGKGTIARVAFSPKEYAGLGGGVAYYLSAVQIKELVTYSENPFEVEDDIPFGD
jgi:hypothetical protein